ncbi:MAG: HNH endonuclease [Gammaproteobacteria bacterium]|nr:HNH endonuclease [Gammaproteobacteria bacterium]
MRPIEKHTPLDDRGRPKTYSAYQNARGDLIDQLGDYCCYCGAQLDASLAVEHVQAKDTNPALALKWGNFLLVCTNCNSTKSNKTIVLQDYYWPDQDNTHLAFVYGAGGTVAPHPGLNDDQRLIAKRTLQLIGLDKRPGNYPARSDRRWINRKKAWDMAQAAKNLLFEQDTPKLRTYIATSATQAGFWSVWVTVFKEDNDMLQRLTKAFPGTFQAFQSAEVRPR